MYRRLGQGYLALGEQLDGLVDEYERAAADWHDVERARFAVDVLTSALAPTNFLHGTPPPSSARSTPAGPAWCAGCATSRTTSGTTAACRPRPTAARSWSARTWRRRPGDVVDRDDVAELIQYRPSTPTVPGTAAADHPAADRPLLLPRPAPGPQLRGVRGQPRTPGVPVSWRNPTAEQADWDIDTYAAPDPARRRRRQGDHRRRGRQHARLLRRRHPDVDGAQPPRGDTATTACTPPRSA